MWAAPSLWTALALASGGCAATNSTNAPPNLTPAKLAPAPAAVASFSAPPAPAPTASVSVAKPRLASAPTPAEPGPASDAGSPVGSVALASYQGGNVAAAPARAEFEVIPPGELPPLPQGDVKPPKSDPSREGLLPPPAWTFSLGNVFYLANAQNPNVGAAVERINEAYARLDRAEALWIPSLRMGMNYNHHEGPIQDVAGNVFQTSRSALYGGFGANAVGAASPAVPGLLAQFHVSDAIFQPRIAEHQAASRQFAAAAARNDVLRDAAVTYLELLRAEHALAVTQDALRNTERLADLTRQYAETGQGLESDFQRVEAELAGRMNDVFVQVEAVQVASARLAQLMHADPTQLIATQEPAVAPIEVLPLECGPAEYVAMGLMRRPELAERRHLTGEAVARMRREKFAPLVPSVVLGLSYGGFGGGLGGTIANTSDRLDADAIAYWELRNLGVGEKAARGETSSVVRQTQLREAAQLDVVAREVVEAHSQVVQRRRRIELARRGMEAAQRSYTLNQQRI
ncbi:MAG TPA: TolC family protein, partial [Pirellulales bacterium]